MKYYTHFPAPNMPKNALQKALVAHLKDLDGKIVTDLNRFKRDLGNYVTHLNREHLRCRPLDNNNSWMGYNNSVCFGFSRDWTSPIYLYQIKE